MAIVYALHLLAAIVWVGGMFFAHLVLRPAAMELEPAQRLALWLRVFDRFFQVRTKDKATQGTGLGLAIVREIVEAHGGRVWVEEGVGGGACIRFSLPLQVEPPPVAEAH